MYFEGRYAKFNDKPDQEGPVVYWMQRDQRAHDNYALLFARQLAIENNVPLYVIFNLVPDFLEATWRQYGFMLQGLKETEAVLAENRIPFVMVYGDPADTIPEFVKNIGAGILVSDRNPLKISKKWKRDVRDKINTAFYTVDAHNVVPADQASGKCEFAAYTIRPKIHKLLPEYLTEFPDDISMPQYDVEFPEFDLNAVKKKLNINFDIGMVEETKPGSVSAGKKLKEFITGKLDGYAELRNDPNAGAVSGLSPYMHFGQIAPQRIALAVKKSGKNKDSTDSYLEELIVRRELADNYCGYNKDYDNFNGFHDWAKKTLNEHRDDKRDFIYTSDEFEGSLTDDPLWNAAQNELVKFGTMHGYMRMYWAKKILEWSESPEKAQEIAIYLNDKYQLDGRDPNGYTGIAWSIGGVHDRAWPERNIYGKIRYMNSNGASRKFDTARYIERFSKR